MAIYGERLFYDICGVNKKAFDYLKANQFLKKLRRVEDYLTLTQYKKLKELAVGGDIDGAENKLCEIMMERKNERKH